MVSQRGGGLPLNLVSGWLEVEKVCQSIRHKFKYLNNCKRDQPRYLCLDCKKFYGLHAQKGARRAHPGGYAKRKIKINVPKEVCPSFGCGGYGFEHVLPNGEPSDKSTSSEYLACGTDHQAILPNQHAQQLQEDYHVIPYQNLMNYSEVLDQNATSNGVTSIEEANIYLDVVEEQRHNVDLEMEDFTNVFNSTSEQLGYFYEDQNVLDQNATSNGATSIEEANIYLDVVEEQRHNVDLEIQDFTNVFNYTSEQLGYFYEDQNVLDQYATSNGATFIWTW
jgi:uncharacterized protein YqiB (DUF1249 family)